MIRNIECFKKKEFDITWSNHDQSSSCSQTESHKKKMKQTAIKLVVWGNRKPIDGPSEYDKCPPVVTYFEEGDYFFIYNVRWNWLLRQTTTIQLCRGRTPNLSSDDTAVQKMHPLKDGYWKQRGGIFSLFCV